MAKNEIPVEFKDQSNFFDRLDKIKATPIQIKVEVTSANIKDISNHLKTELGKSAIEIGNLTISSKGVNTLKKNIEDALKNQAVRISVQADQQSISALNTQIQQALSNSTFNVNVSASAASLQALSQQIQQTVANALQGGGLPPSGSGLPPRRPPRGGRSRGLLSEEIFNVSRGLPSAAGVFYPQSRLQNAEQAVAGARQGTSASAIANRLTIARLEQARNAVPDAAFASDVRTAISQIRRGNLPANLNQLFQNINANSGRGSIRELKYLNLGSSLANALQSLQANPQAIAAAQVATATDLIKQGQVPANINQLQQTIGAQSNLTTKTGLSFTKLGRSLANAQQAQVFSIQKNLAGQQRNDELFDELDFYRTSRQGFLGDIKRGLYNAADPRLIQAQARLKALQSDPTLSPARRQKAFEFESAIERERQDADKRLSEAQTEAKQRGILADISGLSKKYDIDPSKLSKGRFFDTSRLTSRTTQHIIGRNAAEALLFQGPLQGIGSALGGATGGAIAGEAGAATGSFVGVTAVNFAIEAFNKLKDTMIEAAKAGLSYQRSIIAISAVLLQNTEIISTRTGQPLDTVQQLAINKQRAAQIQQFARSAAAEVGIAGEAESNLTQAIITGAGARGITLTPEQTATLVQRFGAAINQFAPDLASSPNFIRRDIVDILTGSGAASRTVLGSRLGQVTSQVGQAQTGDELLRFTKSMDALVFTFRNSGEASVKIQILNSKIQQLQQDLGKEFIDQLTPALNDITVALSDPNLLEGLKKLGKGLGDFTNKVIQSATFLTAGRVQVGDKSIPVGPILRRQAEVGIRGAGGIFEEIVQLIIKEKEREENKGKSKPGSKDQPDKDTTTEASALAKFTALFGELPTLGQLSEKSPAVQLEKAKQGLAIKRFDTTEKTLSALVKSTNTQLEGLQGIQKEQASLFGQTKQGRIEGIRSQFEGESSFAEQIKVAERPIKELTEELQSIRESGKGLSGEAANINKRRESELLGLISASKVEAQSIRDQRFQSVLGLGAARGEAANLEAEGISRVGFAGRRKFAQAQIRAQEQEILGLQEQRGQLDPAEKEELDKVIAGRFARLSESKAQERLGALQDFGQTATLGKSLIAANTAVEQLPNELKELKIAFDLAKDSVKDFAKETKLAGLQGEEKIIGLIQKLRETGGAETSEQESLIRGLFPDSAASILTEGAFGSEGTLSSLFRKRDIASSELDVAIQQERRRIKEQPKTLLEREDAARSAGAAVEGFDLEVLSRKIQQTLAIGNLAQFFSGTDKENPFESKFQESIQTNFPELLKDGADKSLFKIPESPNKSLQQTASAMADLVTYFKGAFKTEIAQAVKDALNFNPGN